MDSLFKTAALIAAAPYKSPDELKKLERSLDAQEKLPRIYDLAGLVIDFLPEENELAKEKVSDCCREATTQLAEVNTYDQSLVAVFGGSYRCSECGKPCDLEE